MAQTFNFVCHLFSFWLLSVPVAAFSCHFPRQISQEITFCFANRSHVQYVYVWRGCLFLIQVMSPTRLSIVKRGFHPLTSDVPVIQSNYIERNRYCYTQGIDSRQNRKVKGRLHSHLQPRTTSLESHTLLLTHRFGITWTSNFNISVITNPKKVAQPHLCLSGKCLAGGLQ